MEFLIWGFIWDFGVVFFFLVIFLWISFGVFGAGWLRILFGIWRILWGIEGGGSYLDFFGILFLIS